MAEGRGHDGSLPLVGMGSKSAAARTATPMVAELDEDIAHATTEDPHRRPGLVRLLANYGVDTVFGIPGVHTLELYRGLPGSGIRHVLTRHEQGAGFMADGYARVSGKPGCASSSPGRA